MVNIANRDSDTSTPPRRGVRVVVKIRADFPLPYSNLAQEALKQAQPAHWNSLSERFPGSRLTPYFSNPVVQSLRAIPQRNAGAQGSIFAQYYSLEAAPTVDLQRLADAAMALPFVELAYVEAGPTPPPVEPRDDPYSRHQRYLDSAPVGIDARHAWERGLNGNGISFVDVEQGWTLNHEDLLAAQVSLLSGANHAFHGHGTAVLGQIVSVDNAIGCVGIAPAVAAKVVSQYRSASPYDYKTAEAILSAIPAMEAGGIMLLEAQTTHHGYPGRNDMFPVEIEELVFQAIHYATTKAGIVVVEAGGNGFRDLDTFDDGTGVQPLNRNSPGFRDSGAILVGAAGSASRSRLNFSNYGSRIDCYAWGENVTSCGDGGKGTALNAYTHRFNGTSSASPIVAGAAILTQELRQKSGLAPLTPHALRALLSDPAWNTPSADPATDRIGVMPDLRQILARATSA